MGKPLVRKAKPRSKRLRAFHVGEGMPSLTSLREELQDMTDVLLGRREPPVNNGTLALMEVADAYYARASELTQLIQQQEADGHIPASSAWSKFRKGELRTFREMTKAAADLGSRRLTAEQIELDKERFGRESA